MNTNIEEMIEKVGEMLKGREIQDLKKVLSDMNPMDAAEIIAGMPEEEQAMVFRLIPKDLAADTFVELDADIQENLIRLFSEKDLKKMLDDIKADDMTDLLDEMPANVVDKILATVDPRLRAEVNVLLNYPKDSAGALMTTEYVSLKQSTKVADAISWIRKNGNDKEDVYTCYVTDGKRFLQGIVTMRDMLLSDDTLELSAIMNTNLISVETQEDKENVAKLFSKYDLSALPVVDSENRLIGIITVDDAIDVLQDEDTEDFEKMAAIMPHEDSYFATSVWHHARNRLPWLLVLMFSSIFTGLIINKYEAAFATLPVLVSLMPMLSDTGGNCGSQTSTLIIRGMAVDEIRLKDFLRVFWKELRISLLVGVILACANGIRIYIQYGNPMLSLIIVLTLIFVVVTSKLMGCCLPMLAKAIHMDPAIMASPLLTTVVDICSVWIYFKIAVALMI